MVNSEEFSKRLEQIMQRHELNASSFAEKVGVGRSSISHILSGRNKPSLDFVLSVLKEFNDVELYWLLNGKGSYPKSSTEEKVQIKQVSPAVESAAKETEPKETDETNSNELTTNVAPDSDSTSKIASIEKGKNISKVIWFYSDGTFDEFIPNA